MVRLEKRNLLKAFIAVPLCFVLYSFHLASAPSSLSLSEQLEIMVFGKMDFNYSYAYIMTIENIAFIMLFNLMFSTHITTHFRYSCVYVFSRLRDRRRWYAARMLEIIICALIYTLLYVISVLVICMIVTGRPLDSVTLYRCFMVFLFSFLIVCSSTLLINLLALKFGTGAGFFIVEGIIFALVVIFMLTYDLPWAAYVNPLACLNLFNSPKNTAWVTTANNFIIFAAVFLGGMKYVSGYDVAMFDAELN